MVFRSLCIAVVMNAAAAVPQRPVLSGWTAAPTSASTWVAANKKRGKAERGKAEHGKADKKKGRAAKPSAPQAPAAPQQPAKMEALDLDAPPPAADPSKTVVAPALDLSAPMDAGTEEKAKKDILQGADPASKKGATGKKADGGGLDFSDGGEGDGGLTFDFGTDQPALTLGGLNVTSPERQRFELAMRAMNDEDYPKASLEFKYFQTDPAFAEFSEESEYQLGKALYKMNFFDGSLKQFQVILEKGPAHRRYRKAVEWLFFMSRKLADQTPVLAQLARYRNVTFPKAYRNEYNYLLAKYLFVQADDFEVKRIQEEELARGKKAKENTLDFGVIADAIDSTGGGGAVDFSQIGGAGGLDFSAGSMDFGGASGGGMDFGAASGGGMDFGSASAPAGGGAIDFGAPLPPAPPGSGLDFGAPAAPGGGGLDFGAPAAPGGGMDFGAGPAKPATPSGPAPVAPPTTAKEAIKQGLDLVEQVKPESTFYPRTKYLNGLLHYLNGEDQKAVESFQEVVRVLNPREGARLDPKLREMAFLSLARIHYGYKQFNRSVYYYDLIDRDSESWLTALFEASWAYYRRGDFEKALGNLLTLHSPFFEKEYFPESQIVKAIIYFEACRYPETRSIVDDFIKRYTALMREMQKIAESKDAPEELANKIAQLQASVRDDEDDVTARVVSLTLASPEIRQSRAVVKEEEAQRKQLDAMDEKFKQSDLGVQVSETIKNAYLDRSRFAGEVTRKKFEQELYKLKSLLAQALRIKIEVSRAERDVLEKKMQHVATHDEIIPAEQRTVVDDEHVYWPYEGEFWRDELGTYELDFSMCKQVATE